MTDQVVDKQATPAGPSGRGPSQAPSTDAAPQSVPLAEPPAAADQTGEQRSAEHPGTTDGPAPEPKRKPRLRWRLAQGLLALAALAVGVGIMTALARTAPQPQQAPQPVQGPLVSVQPVNMTDAPVEVTGFGTVQPRRQVNIVPQVGGQVVDAHPALTAGGIIQAGQTVVQVDRRDYALAVRTAKADLDQARGALAEAEAGVEQARASIEQARTALAVEQAEADVRVAEWRDQRGEDATAPDLVARRPQIRERRAMLASAEAQHVAAQASVASAKARLASAEAALERAQLDLERTTIKAPFDARVMNESVDPGQTAVAGQSLATLYSREVMRIVVPLDDASLRWVELPEAEPGVSPEAAYERGVPVRVTANYAGKPRQWAGRALHTTGQVDPRSRLVEVVVEVRQPTDQTDPPPLVPGMFVTARFQGPVLEDVARIPRHAIRESGQVWVAEQLRGEIKPIPWSEPSATDMNLHARLRLRDVEVARTDRDTALIREGLKPGDLVVTSALDVVTDGMRIRLPTPATRPTSERQQELTPDTTPRTPADAEPEPGNASPDRQRQ